MNLLLLEGSDDYHVVKNLAKRHEFITDKLEERCTIKNFNQEDGGITTLLGELSVALKGSYERIGIVVDADTDLENRWRQLCGKLATNGTQIPDKPDSQGTILDYVANAQVQKLIKVGIWIMPDNQERGMLEDFVRLLISENDDMEQFADQCLDDMIVKKTHRFNAELHRTKAFIHTWLAWQEEPGKPMGLAITMKYFDADKPIAHTFVAWLRKLFDEY